MCRLSPETTWRLGKVPANLGGRDYANALKEIVATGIEHMVPIHFPAAPDRKRARLAIEDLDIDGGDDGIFPLIDDVIAPLIDVIEGVDIDGGDGKLVPNSGSSSSSSSSSSSDSSIDGDETYRYPKDIMGRNLRREKHKLTGDEGLRVTCPEHGATCRKFRGAERRYWIIRPRGASTVFDVLVQSWSAPNVGRTLPT